MFFSFLLDEILKEIDRTPEDLLYSIMASAEHLQRKEMISWIARERWLEIIEDEQKLPLEVSII